MNRFPGWMKIVLILMVLGLLIGGVWFYRAQNKSFKREAYSELTTIAQLKVDQITQWRAERLGDGAVLMESPFLAVTVAGFLKNPNPGNTEKILSRFRSLQKHYHYHDVLLVDRSGRVRLRLNAHPGLIHEMVRQAMMSAFRDRRPVMTDLHVTPEHFDPLLDVVAPIFSGKLNSGPPIGAVLLQSDVRQFLYPLIQSWPVPSRTAETVLVRREGETVLFLSEPRYQKGAAFRLRIPLTRSDVSAVMAVSGQTGVVEAKDYRGINVLSALKAVPGTSWFIVAKMDTAEALSVLRRESILILLLFFVLVGAAAAGVGAIWQRNDKIQYRELFEAGSALRESEDRFRLLVEHAPDAIAIFDVDENRFVQVNTIAERLFGCSHQELLEHGPQDFYAPVQPDGHPIEESVKINIKRVLDGESIMMERLIHTASGQERVCEVRLVRLPSLDRRLIRNSFIDVTERKGAEEKLRESREQMRALAARLQTAREEERTGVAREIHDVLAQELTRLKIDLVWLQHRLTKGGTAGGPEALLERVAEMVKLADTAIHSVQKISTDLRPAVLDSLGLCAAVEWQAQDFQKRSGIRCRARVPENESPVDRDSATATFRILQESLVNVMRHAQATEVDILLQQEDHGLFLRVRDNGCGIDEETLASPLSIGLAGMRERALLLGGTFEIQSRLGSGTIIEMRLPLSKREKISEDTS